MNEETSQALAQAMAIQNQINDLNGKLDLILDPICEKVMDRNDPKEIAEVINLLPTGFHRSELRTWANMQNAKAAKA